MEPHNRNCEINHKFQEKDCQLVIADITVGTCEKESKTIILFRNHSSRSPRVFSTIGAGMMARQTARGAVTREEMFMMRKLPKTKVARHLEMLVAYQNNPSEEVI